MHLDPTSWDIGRGIYFYFFCVCFMIVQTFLFCYICRYNKVCKEILFLWQSEYYIKLVIIEKAKHSFFKKIWFEMDHQAGKYIGSIILWLLPILSNVSFHSSHYHPCISTHSAISKIKIIWQLMIMCVLIVAGSLIRCTFRSQTID